MNQPIGIFGGTFDPIHYGHLRTAFELGQALALAQVRFLPTGDPPHREAPLAPAALRLAMVRAAVGRTNLQSTIARSAAPASPPWTADGTAWLPGRSLLLSAWTFLGMPGWHRWRGSSRSACGRRASSGWRRRSPGLGGSWWIVAPAACAKHAAACGLS
jgi:nicotinate-nucleotide adenylyltransferase